MQLNSVPSGSAFGSQHSRRPDGTRGFGFSQGTRTTGCMVSMGSRRTWRTAARHPWAACAAKL
ncbi:hypothetical protein CY34DRAFT_738550 [Suillus luteus UH-Slu-Lm8-n1]|uniref:Uncharacterized protein n=1 Tax=Suillus luteus UH-Slu-Lm8-n1 TaxID=930992 RepID=A0A0D0A4A7_9AGAM|nr:hypothetical protein CY34DRAFT_738550 [Suillus luteus UH-Slu-Lm8-n1]